MKKIFMIVLFISGTAQASCYTDVTVNWVSYPEWHDGAFDEGAITVSFTGTNTTGNHQASFRNLSDKKMSGLLSILLSAQATGKKLTVNCSNDAAGYTANNILIKTQ